MTARRIRSAAGAGLIALTVLTAHGCDVLNPAFVNQLGGSAARSGPQPTGSILVVVNNQTTSQIQLNYDQEVRRAGEGVVIYSGGFAIPAGTYFVFSSDCSTTGIIFTSLTVGGVDVALAVNEFRAPALQCGSIVYVTIQGVGATAIATAELF